MTEADARERYGDDAVADPRSRAERTSVDSAADVLTKAGGASSK
jgi:hypothetical protein